MRRSLIVSGIVLSACVFKFCSCDDPVFPPGPLDKTPLWETRINVNFTNPFKGLNLLEVMPVAQGVAMVPYTDNGLYTYAGIDVENGSIKWISGEAKRIKNITTARYSQQVGNILYFHGDDIAANADGTAIRTLPLYAYDVPTGTLQFKKTYPQVRGDISALSTDGKFFVSKAETPIGDGRVRTSFSIVEFPDFDTPRQLLAPLSSNFVYADGTKRAACVSDFKVINGGGDTFLIYMSCEPKFNQAPDIGEVNSNFYISCYNLSKQQWIYKNKPALFAGYFLAADGDYTYWGYPGSVPQDNIAGLRCYNWKNGEEVWYLSEDALNPNTRVTLGSATYDPANRVIVSHELEFVCGVDATSGTVKWRTPPGVGNLTSPILIHNGVAYSVTAYVNGFDVVTGERLMRASCPSVGRTLDGQELGTFSNQLGMYIREDGKPVIIAVNEAYAYAFEGVR